ncbi:sensor histidine kinase [Halorussus marinus]|uniref:sensor histidine kinase n=1 Tax=Halorussus marinus TaxID=2505976 RepID=UPI00106E95AC|nr:HAMP domain-containing sensor histidine kinase [Halorussus marinus]
MVSPGELVGGPLVTDPRAGGLRRDLRRAVASAVIGLTGFVLLIPNVSRLIASPTSTIELVLAGVGSVVSIVLVAASYLIYRADFTTKNTLRIAAWNTLGVLVLGSVLGLVSLYRPVTVPPFVIATVLGVSTAAHVIIGVNDVRRIRAEDLATEREKTAVLNRLIRHNLRNDAQVLTGYAEKLATDVEDPQLAEAARRVHGKADSLGSMYDKVARIQETIEADSPETRPVALAPLAEEIATEFREAHPDAEIDVDVPTGLAAAANDQFRRALGSVVENAVQHTDAETPRVAISARQTHDRVTVRIEDNGPGIPDDEAAVVAGDRALTQLEHGSGFGLWQAKWVVESLGGTLSFPDDADGGVVALRLDAAT